MSRRRCEPTFSNAREVARHDCTVVTEAELDPNGSVYIRSG
jgi:hypothetical protein